jgi:hypothetical protein
MGGAVGGLPGALFAGLDRSRSLSLSRPSNLGACVRTASFCNERCYLRDLNFPLLSQLEVHHQATS